MTIQSDTSYMQMAIDAAISAASRGEVPVGAVIVDSDSGRIMAIAGNRTEGDHDPAGHAEIIALRQAAQILKTPRLTTCDIYVTLEPCAMCAAALAQARIRRIYFGAYDPKGGGIDHGPRIFTQPTTHHHPDIYGGIAEAACAAPLLEFFKEKRK